MWPTSAIFYRTFIVCKNYRNEDVKFKYCQIKQKFDHVNREEDDGERRKDSSHYL